jgi:3-oxoacyl-[acyl-carrier protein] reductase
MNGHGLLKDKVAIVTGGSMGIGRSIVLKYAQEGAKVFFNYASHHDDALKTKKLAEEMGREVFAENVSVTDTEAVGNFVDMVTAQCGRIDILVNNAGISKDNFFLMMKDTEWHKVIDVNLNGVYNFCKQVIRTMMGKKAGKIINMSSISGIMGREGQANYAATKGAIISMSKSLARELGQYGINVNVIAPGLIETKMIKKIPAPILKESVRQIPLGRVGLPDDIAGAAVFLASDLSNFVTGAVLNVTGGQL